VSCNRDSWGCDGGWFAHDYFQWKEDQCGDSGAILEQYFPYTATDEPCGCPYPHSYFINSWAYIGDEYGIPSVAAMKQAIMAYGPISVSIYVGPAFRAYRGGVYNAIETGVVNHAVTLVGWDETQGIDGVWILRNSWGTGWGEAGYMRIQYSSNVVGYGACYIDYRSAAKIAILDDDQWNDVTGDGDSIPEAGETAQLVMTFENRFTTPLAGVSATLFCDDARVSVTQGTAYLGDIQPQGRVSNGSSPFEIELPPDYTPRIDSLFVEFVWDGGARIDTQVVERAVGGVTILLADDDNDDSLEKYYQSYLKVHRIPYDLKVQTGDMGSPGQLDIGNYDLVIWFTGDYRTNPLNLIDLTLLRQHLNRGRKLFLTGQGIAAQLDSGDPDFLNNYLRSSYVSSAYIPAVGMAPDSRIFGPDDSALFLGTTGANNQTTPDQISPLNGGNAELRYINNAYMGAVGYVGEYQLLFFSFGFEGITTGDNRWTARDTIMARILDYFDIHAAGFPPGVSAPIVTAPDPNHMVNHTPTISWHYSDPGSRPQQAYQIQITDDQFWLSAPVWDCQAVSADTQITYAGGDLIDGTDYFIRVRVFNGLFWSGWQYGSMHMNSVPVAYGLSPDGFDGVLSDDVTLSHTNPTDLEDDSLMFAYQVYGDSQLTNLIIQSGNRPAGQGGVSSWQIPDTLPAGKSYYWRVRAGYPLEVGDWSPVAAFTVMTYVSGDANGDEAVKLADAVFVVNYVFKSGPAPAPVEAGDANCDATCNLADAVYLINYIFKGGAVPDCD